MTNTLHYHTGEHVHLIPHMVGLGFPAVGLIERVTPPETAPYLIRFATGFCRKVSEQQIAWRLID